MTSIFLTDLHAYNNGILKGEWINLPCDDEELKEAYDRICGTHEYFITDYECEFMKIDEFEDIYELNKKLQEFEDLNEYDQRKVMAYIQINSNDLSKALENYDEIEIIADSIEEIADEMLNYYDIPDFIKNYIDYEQLCKGLSLEYHVTDYGITTI